MSNNNDKKKNPSQAAVTPATPATEAAPPVEEQTTAATEAVETPAEAEATQPEAPSPVPGSDPDAPADTALAVVDATAAETAITAAPHVDQSEVAFDPFATDAFVKLIPMFPTEAKYLKQIKPVTDEEFEAKIAKLEAALVTNFTEALERLNPTKVGDHRRRRQAMQVFDVRLNHGTGNDPNRPKGMPEGGIYSTEGRFLAACDDDMAALHKVPKFFDCFVIAGYDTNTYWPPREDDDDAKAPEGETASKAPICRSIDREMGDKYGACDVCIFRPFKNRRDKNAKDNPDAKDEDKDGCRAEVVLWVVPVDFSGIYRMVFSGSNAKIGRAVMNRYSSWRMLWEHPFRFGSKKEVSQKDKNKRWYLFEPEARMQEKPDFNQGALLNLIARKIDTESYWPEKRRIHLLAAKAEAPQAAAPKANMSALAARAGVAGGLPPSDAAEAPAAPKGAAPNYAKGNNL